MRVRAITLDLDDTLWPIEPVMLRAEQRLDAWLRTHCPPVATADYLTRTAPNAPATQEAKDRAARVQLEKAVATPEATPAH